MAACVVGRQAWEWKKPPNSLKAFLVKKKAADEKLSELAESSINFAAEEEEEAAEDVEVAAQNVSQSALCNGKGHEKFTPLLAVPNHQQLPYIGR